MKKLQSWLRDLVGFEPTPDILPVALAVPSTGTQAISAILDPYNARLKLYNLTARMYQASCLHERVFGAGKDPAFISKVTAYAFPGQEKHWKDLGFRLEGRMKRFFSNSSDACLWAAYPDPTRAHEIRKTELDRIINLAQGKTTCLPSLPEGLCSRLGVPGDADILSTLMRSVFREYPTPLDPTYLRSLLEGELFLFRLVLDKAGNLLAAASAEIDHCRKSAEMTDCATSPVFRGKGLMAYILSTLAQDLRKKFGISDLYTLARSGETGMNCVFSKLGYEFHGRLINNCRMPTGWESMNIWCLT